MQKEGDSSGKHSSHSVEEEEKEAKQMKKSEKIEKPLKMKIPKNKTSFTVIGKLFFHLNSVFKMSFLTC
jgi:hypothetical protein